MSAALDRLQRRTLDLMLIHWPGVQGLHVQDARNAQLRSETWRALEQHYAEGHVRAIGVSNYTIGHLKTLLDECSLRPHVLQVELHPLLYQRELIEFCRREGIVVQAYSSFGEGALLRGGVTAGVGGNNDVDSTDLLPELDSLALRYSLDRATLLLHWALSKGIAVIPKSAHAERIRANIDGQLRHDVDVFKRLANDPEWLALDAISAQRERRFCWDPSSVR